MQIYRAAKRFDVENQEDKKEKTNTKEDLWLKLDVGLKIIEDEWKKRMIMDQYSKEFTTKIFRMVNHVDDLTVEELKCWYRLLNIKLEDKCKMGDVYFKNETNHNITEIYVTYWDWLCNRQTYQLIDIYFKIKNNTDTNEYGAVFLSDEIILINDIGLLHETDDTPLELIKRLSAFEELRK